MKPARPLIIRTEQRAVLCNISEEMLINSPKRERSLWLWTPLLLLLFKLFNNAEKHNESWKQFLLAKTLSASIQVLLAGQTKTFLNNEPTKQSHNKITCLRNRREDFPRIKLQTKSLEQVLTHFTKFNPDRDLTVALNYLEADSHSARVQRLNLPTTLDLSRIFSCLQKVPSNVRFCKVK